MTDTAALRPLDSFASAEFSATLGAMAIELRCDFHVL